MSVFGGKAAVLIHPSERPRIGSAQTPPRQGSDNPLQMQTCDRLITLTPIGVSVLAVQSLLQVFKRASRNA